MHEFYILMAHLCDLDEDTGEQEIAEAFYNKYNIDEEDALDLIADLLPLCNVQTSGITGIKYRGFSTDKLWLLKQAF